MNIIIDLRKVYAKHYDKPSTNLNGMLDGMSMTFEGREHSGLDDSKNIARMFIQIMNEGYRMDSNTNLLKKKVSYILSLKIKGKWKEMRKTNILN
jgi:inhibitor of KinA sporulation pathway (predicted exonuclease)